MPRFLIEFRLHTRCLACQACVKTRRVASGRQAQARHARHSTSLAARCAPSARGWQPRASADGRTQQLCTRASSGPPAATRARPRALSRCQACGPLTGFSGGRHARLHARGAPPRCSAWAAHGFTCTRPAGSWMPATGRMATRPRGLRSDGDAPPAPVLLACSQLPKKGTLFSPRGSFRPTLYKWSLAARRSSTSPTSRSACASTRGPFWSMWTSSAPSRSPTSASRSAARPSSSSARTR